MEKYIGIDIGTTYIKGSILDLNDMTVNDVIEVDSPERIDVGNRTYFEESTSEYFDKIMSLIDFFQGKYDCEGVLISCQLHCFLLCDTHMNQITNLITWQDMRASEQNRHGVTVLDELNNMIDSSFVEITGTNLKLGLPLCNLYHYIQQENKRKEYVFCTLGSYINWRLTGNLVCHTTTAASTGLLDIKSKTWSKDLIAILSLEYIKFPEVIEECVPIGNKGGLKVFVDVGDQQATIYGLVNQDKQGAIITIGTAGLASHITCQITSGEYETRPYFNGYYINTVRRQIGGRNFDVLTNLIEEIGLVIFNDTIEKGKLYSIVNALTNKQDLDSNDLTIEMKFYDGQIGVKHGRVDNISHQNFNIGSIFRAACKHTVLSYICALKKLNVPGDQRVTLSGKLFDSLDYLRGQFELQLGSRVNFINRKNESMYGLLYLAIDYERRLGDGNV